MADHPLQVAADRFVLKLADVVLDSVGAARDAVDLGQLESALARRDADGAMFALEAAVDAAERVLTGATKPKAADDTDPKRGLEAVIAETVAAGGTAIDLCVESKTQPNEPQAAEREALINALEPSDDTPVRVRAKEAIQQDISDRLKDTWISPSEYYPQTTDGRMEWVKDRIERWAQTSGDSNPQAVALQVAIKEEFGLSAASIDHFGREALEAARQLSAAERADLRLFVRAQYEATQEWFRRHNISHVSLVRGAHYPGWEDQAGTQSVGALKLQPASSFTTDVNTASAFGTTIHAVRVPVADVFSTARTGVGCLSESEVVVLGKKQKTITVVRDPKSQPIYADWLARVTELFKAHIQRRAGEQSWSPDDDIKNADWPKQTKDYGFW